jgi:glycosyltransferase involved in cell wall biosynthesis
MVIHIAVNALSITSEPSGNRTYLLNLLEELTPLAGDSFYFSLFVSGQKIADEFSSRISPHNTRCIVFPRQVISPLLRIAVEQLYLPLWIRQNEVDLLFAARNVMPLLTNCITVIGVLSMHLNYDENVIPCWKKFYGKKILEASARRADAYISISEYAGETYVRKYNVSRDRLFVSRLGFRRDAIVVGEEINSNPIASEYLLFVSTLFPHKNASFLLKVFAEVAHKRPATKLVIVGRDFKNAVENLKKKALVLGIADRVDFRGPVSGTELKQLYRHAKVFVFPSLVEGFGLSVLELLSQR